MASCSGVRVSAGLMGGVAEQCRVMRVTLVRLVRQVCKLFILESPNCLLLKRARTRNRFLKFQF